MNSFYTQTELEQLNFQSLGENVLISRKVSIYGSEKIAIGNNERIDDFCILRGKIIIGNYVHIAAYVGVFAPNSGVVFEDFSGISSRCAIYAQSDDYSGYALTNPTVSMEYRNILAGKVVVGKHVVIGTGTTVLPGVTIAEGASVGSMSLVNKNLDPWGIYAGVPAKYLKARSQKILDLEQKFLQSEAQ